MARTALLALLASLLASPAQAQVRVKDLTSLDGARSNYLVGYGLVVGLAGTGSRNLFTQQAAADMLQRLNQTARIFNQSPADPVLRSTNISSVVVTAEIGPFNRCGTRIDVQVSSIDDAISLQGGMLVQTPLYGVDGQVYAVAQGPLTIGGFIVGGQAAAVQKNHTTVGRVVNGGLVEKEALGEVVCRGKSRFLLKDPDWNTARKIARAMNEFSAGCALAEDAGAIVVCLPPSPSPVGFLAELGLLDVKPDGPARVVINERTGTVVVGAEVKLAATAIAHGNLTIVVGENPEVSQPAPFSRGRTAVVPRTTVEATEQRTLLNVVPRTTTVGDLARALNALGVSSRDLISIFQALKAAGALYAEIEKL
ncbi:MAG: flagellar basal body P-ring protein FlgI [Gemmataceae bacterium]|nr:flagellar basal body P-ring protein FlgI [Gemmataceae bacterium]